MRESRFRRPQVLHWPLTTGVLVLLLASWSNAQEAHPITAIQLRPGVMIDTAAGRAYVMSPAGGIDAVGLSDGKTLWSTKAAAKPLGVAGDQTVIGQAEPDRAGDALKIVALKAQDGTPLLTTEKPLNAAGVIPSVAMTLNGEFIASAEPAGPGVRVSWHYRQIPKRGLPEGTVERIQPPTTKRGFPSGTVERIQPPREQPAAISLGPPGAVSSKSQGSFLLDHRTGKTIDLDPRAAALGPAAATAPTLPASDRIPGFPGPQFASADGRYIMVSKRMGDDRIWDKYTLTVYDRAGKNRVGEFRSHVAMAPFVVTDHRILLTTRAYSRRTEKGMVQETDKLRAVNLQTGKELWNHPIRDTALGGPLPP